MSSPALIPETRPISDLRTRLPEIERIAKETGEPIVLTRNGKQALVVQDSDAYNQRLQHERHVRKLREAEIEAKYQSGSVSIGQSRVRMAELARFVEALHA